MFDPEPENPEKFSNEKEPIHPNIVCESKDGNSNIGVCVYCGMKILDPFNDER